MSIYRLSSFEDVKTCHSDCPNLLSVGKSLASSFKVRCSSLVQFPLDVKWVCMLHTGKQAASLHFTLVSHRFKVALSY
jgi:hypothetical protein